MPQGGGEFHSRGFAAMVPDGTGICRRANLPTRWKAPSRCPCWAATTSCSFPTRKISSRPATRMWKRCGLTWSVPLPSPLWFFWPRNRTGAGASSRCWKRRRNWWSCARLTAARPRNGWSISSNTRAWKSPAAWRKKSPGSLKSARIRARRQGLRPSICSGCARNWKNC